MLKGLYLLNTEAFDLIYGPAEREAIARSVEMVGPQQTSASIHDNLALLKDVEVIFSGWGMAPVD